MFRIRWGFVLLLLLGCGLLFLNACHRESSEAVVQPRFASPVEELWFRDVLHFMGRIHTALNDPAKRVELRMHLNAGREEWALKRMGIHPDEVHALLARLELLRPQLEARWPELSASAGGAEAADYQQGLVDWLRSPAWPPKHTDAAKNPEYVCAAVELFDNLSRCVSWSPIARAFCMYEAYLRYAQHLTLGC